MKKPKRSTQKKKADDLCRAIVRGRGHCEAAGLDGRDCNGFLQWAHVITRANHRLRWEPEAALLLCAAHHKWYTHEPWAWKDFIEKHFPARYAFVMAHKNEPWDRDYEAVFERLSVFLK